MPLLVPSARIWDSAGGPRDPLTWAPLLEPIAEGHRRSAWIKCRNGHLATLTDHQIAHDGTVTPSVVCPADGCDFHEHVQLAGWPGGGR